MQSVFFKITGIVYAALLMAFLLTGCYRMPTEDEYSVIPRTNNPDIIREKVNPLAPSVNY